MRPRESLAMLAAASVLVSACSASAETADTEATAPPAPTSTTAGTIVASTTTSTESSTTTTTEGVEVLLPANDVDDPTEAIVAILEYVSYLHTIPEQGASYLDLVYLETCDCYETVLSFLAQYSAEGWVQDDGGIIVHEVAESQVFGNGNVLLQVTESWSPQFVITEDGSRIRLDEDEFINKVVFFGLERSEDRRWRVAVTGRLGEITEGGG